MKILVTGASGFIGRALIPRLVAEKYSVKVLLRREDESLKVDDFCIGDITKAETLRGCAQDVDAIIHIAGKLGEFGVDEKIYEQVHVQGTKNILEEACRAKVKHFIHTSSAGVLGPLLRIPADESFPYAPSNIYENTKCEAEKIVGECCQKNKIDYTVLRPEFVYGPGDLHVLGLFKAVRDGKFFLIGGGKTYLHPTYIGSVVESYILALKRKKSAENCFLIAGEKAVTVKELAGVIASKLKVKPPGLSIPTVVAGVGANILELLSGVFPFTPPLSVAGVKFFSEDRSFSSALATKEMGYKPVVTLEEGIEKTIQWYVEEGYL